MRGGHREQPARRARGVAEVADHAQEAPGAPERHRHGQQQDRRDRGGHAAAQDGRQHRERQHVRRRGDRGALPERVPRLDLQPPQVAGLAGAADSPPPLTGPIASRAPNSTSSTNSATPSATGLVRNRATMPVSASGASSSSSSSGDASRGDRVVDLGLGGGRASAFGDVLGLERERGDQVADGVEAVAVGQPARRQQRRGRRAAVGVRASAARRSRRAARIWPGLP